MAPRGTMQNRTNFLQSNQYAAVAAYTELWMDEFMANPRLKKSKKTHQSLKGTLDQVIRSCKDPAGAPIPLTPVSWFTITLVILTHYDIIKHDRDVLSNIYASVTGTRAPEEIGHLEGRTVILFTAAKSTDPRPLEEIKKTVSNIHVPWEDLKEELDIKLDPEDYSDDGEDEDEDEEMEDAIDLPENVDEETVDIENVDKDEVSELGKENENIDPALLGR